MIKKILLFLILLIPFISPAQKQGNIWYFGTQCGLDFSSGAPVSITGGQTGTDLALGESQEGTACISDSSGAILFYTGGKTIWNKTHAPMPNGTGLMGGTSSTQSSIIIPKPGNDSLFFVFTSDEFQSYTSPPQKGYRYSVVNMCLDSGKGDVLMGQKNILLLDSATEKLAACEDVLKTGYWIMGHKMFSDEFHAWHLTASGISADVISHIGTVHGAQFMGWSAGSAQGQMKFDPAGTKLAVALGNNQPAVLDLFDFDANTGIVNNACHITIDSAFDKRIYGVEFSPDGSKIYATLSGGFGGKRLYQYDLSSGGGDCSAVIASRTTLFQSNSNSVMFGMQLAPDNKIYLICNSYYNLGCIQFPDLTGTAAGFDSMSVAVSGVINNYTLPTFIAGYKYHNKLSCCDCDTLLPDTSKTFTIVTPNVFTPNNDGVNDEWIVDHLPKDTHVHIYDRWGIEVTGVDTPFSVQNIYRWDGRTIAGEPCSAGVYYYVINTPSDTYKGFFQLFR